MGQRVRGSEGQDSSEPQLLWNTRLTARRLPGGVRGAPVSGGPGSWRWARVLVLEVGRVLEVGPGPGPGPGGGPGSWSWRWARVLVLEVARVLVLEVGPAAVFQRSVLLGEQPALRCLVSQVLFSETRGEETPGGRRLLLRASGPQGPQGLGPSGPQGPQGPRALRGLRGLGASGASGPQGPQGPQALRVSGASGPQGPQGLGPSGASGFQGFQGFRPTAAACWRVVSSGCRCYKTWGLGVSDL
ncbi:hypothetical protein EYF80_065010 [Liparis tanakae]|uniref:Uncharacterized protein n=1 Tax=Liparis tanakae TaxID=230148 RepID=A0A4Z2E8K9_9TELE|nr:hypothetical protein EYF80_065010 [Liparis tanakae]